MEWLTRHLSQNPSHTLSGRSTEETGQARRHFCQTLIQNGLACASAAAVGFEPRTAAAERSSGVGFIGNGILGLGHSMQARGLISASPRPGGSKLIRARGEIELRGPRSGLGRGDFFLDANSWRLVRGQLEYSGQSLTSDEPKQATWLMDTTSNVFRENGLKAPLPSAARQHGDWVTSLLLLRYLPLRDNLIIETRIWLHTEWKDPWTPQILLYDANLRCSSVRLGERPALRVDGTLTPTTPHSKQPTRKLQIWISDDEHRHFLRGQIPWLNTSIAINIETTLGSKWPVQRWAAWPKDIRMRLET